MYDDGDAEDKALRRRMLPDEDMSDEEAGQLGTASAEQTEQQVR